MNALTPEQTAAFCAYINALAARAVKRIESTIAQIPPAADQDAVNRYAQAMVKHDQLRRNEGR